MRERNVFDCVSPALIHLQIHNLDYVYDKHSNSDESCIFSVCALCSHLHIFNAHLHVFVCLCACVYYLVFFSNNFFFSRVFSPARTHFECHQPYVKINSVHTKGMKCLDEKKKYK